MSESERTASPSEAAAGPDRAHDLAVGLLVVALSFGLYFWWAIVLFAFLTVLVGGEPTDAQLAMVDPPALALGVGTGAAIYFAHSRHDASFLDVDVPERTAPLYVVVGVAVLLGLNYAVGYLYTVFEVPTPEHGTVETIQTADPLVVAFLVVAAVVFIGPAEELLFRNVLQKRLTGSFSWVGAVLVSSAIFAIAHSAAYFTEDPVQVAGSLATVFLLSLVLGYVYERTRNLPVVALIHGLYDAVLFSLVYTGVSAAILPW